MKFILVITIVIGLLPFDSISQDTSFNKDSAILRNLEYRWLTAEFSLDTAAISEMMDPSFISIGDTSILSKQEELDGVYKSIMQRIKNNHIVDALYFDDFTVKIYGNAAIVTFISVTNGTINGVLFSNRKTRIYDVWRKKDGQWKAVSSQITPIR